VSRSRDEFYYVPRAIIFTSDVHSRDAAPGEYSSSERAYRRTYRLNIHMLNKLARSLSNIPDELLFNSMSDLFRRYVLRFPVAIAISFIIKARCLTSARVKGSSRFTFGL